ncbi:MAG: hypothetical protein AAF740_14325, partial [Bacteroidota bacterium]
IRTAAFTRQLIEAGADRIGTSSGLAIVGEMIAGFHALNTSMFELASAYRDRGMAGYSELQEREFGLQEQGFKAIKHQSFVGTGYFDAVQNTVQQGKSSTVAMAGSTEEDQFH